MCSNHRILVLCVHNDTVYHPVALEFKRNINPKAFLNFPIIFSYFQFFSKILQQSCVRFPLSLLTFRLETYILEYTTSVSFIAFAIQTCNLIELWTTHHKGEP